MLASTTLKPEFGRIPLDWDRAGLTPRADACRAAFKVLDALAQESPEDFVLGIAACFAAVSRRLSTQRSPQDLYEMGRRIIDPAPFDREANLQVGVINDMVSLQVLGRKVEV